MAPMAIDESMTGSTHIDVDADLTVENVIVSGAGPAGLMLACVLFSRIRHHVVLTEPT